MLGLCWATVYDAPALDRRLVPAGFEIKAISSHGVYSISELERTLAFHVF